jgi:hypothetical protein
MNNSISNSLPSRTFQSSLLTSRKLQSSRFEQNAQNSSTSENKTTLQSSSMERRMSVVNLEAGLSVQNSYTPEKVNEMSLVYRFSQASRSRISSNLVNAAASLRSLNYLR